MAFKTARTEDIYDNGKGQRTRMRREGADCGVSEIQANASKHSLIRGRVDSLMLFGGSSFCSFLSCCRHTKIHPGQSLSPLELLLLLSLLSPRDPVTLENEERHITGCWII